VIIVKDRDLPAGVTPEMAAALVYGRERAAPDLSVVIRTQYPDTPFERRPTDHQSAGPITQPEHLGLAFADLQRAADAAGMVLYECEDGYRLDSRAGTITRKTLGELVDAIKKPEQVKYGQYDDAV
jgi:hypothetical protein